MKLFLQSTFLTISLSVLLLIPGIGVMQANAQVKFTAEAGYNKIGINETVNIRFKVENAKSVEHIQPPEFKKFNVVSGPTQERGMTSINGKTNHYTALSYSIKPVSSGTFTIAPATAMADGKEYKSNPVKITVTRDDNLHPGGRGANAIPGMPNLNFGMGIPRPDPRVNEYTLKPGENATDKIRKNLFIKLEVSKKNCYVGQPITASFKLYTRLRSESSITNAPSFNGFSVSDMNVNDQEKIETYKGREFSTYVLRKVQLYPLQSGEITLDPLESDNRVTFLKRSSSNQQDNSTFNMLQGFTDQFAPSNEIVEKNVNLKSQPVTIHVKPLPDKNVPTSFKGAVGNFSIKASLQKNNFTTDDANNLVITIQGSGNLQMINAPEVTWPKGIDNYDSKVKDHVEKQRVPMKGSKEFSIPFTVNTPGSYTLPGIHFSWFDPATSTYDSAATQPLTFHVEAGKRIQSQIAGAKLANPGKGSWLLNFSSLEITSGVILIAGIFLLALVLFFRKRNKEDDLSTKIQLDEIRNRKEEEESFEIPENPLLSAHEKLLAEDSPGFYAALNNSLKNYLAKKLNVPTEEITKKRISERLDECNVGVGTVRLAESLMDDIDLHLYGGHAHLGQMRSVYERAGELLSLLNKQIC